MSLQVIEVSTHAADTNSRVINLYMVQVYLKAVSDHACFHIDHIDDITRSSCQEVPLSRLESHLPISSLTFNHQKLDVSTDLHIFHQNDP